MDDEILREFLAESWDHLGRLDAAMPALEHEPRDARLRVSVCQTFHNLKETCGFLGLTPLFTVAQSAENLLKRMPVEAGGTGSGPVGGEAVARVQQAVDQLKEMLRGLAETRSEAVEGTGDRFQSAESDEVPPAGEVRNSSGESDDGTFAEPPALPGIQTSQSQPQPLDEERGPFVEETRQEDEQRYALPVLVIDESVFFRQWATLTLEEAGFEVVSCSSYRDAMGRIEQGENFSAILGERNLPGMSGSEFAAWMASQPRSGRTPLIAVSSPLEKTNAEFAPSDAFHRVLEKFDSHDLVSAVWEAVAEMPHLATRS